MLSQSLGSSAVVFTMISAGLTSPARALELKSPDGNIQVTIEAASGVPAYSVAYKGKAVLAPSRLGFSLGGATVGYGGGGPAGPAMDIASSAASSADSSWKPLWGQWSIIPDHFNQLTVDFKESGASAHTLQAVFRAYNEGVAFCVNFLSSGGWGSLSISAENTEFHFASDMNAVTHTSAQGNFATGKLSQIQGTVERPLTLSPGSDGGPFISIAEARMVDYARTRLSAGGTLTMRTSIGGAVTAQAPYSTPWRVLFIADKAVDLLNHQYLIDNLNPPDAIADPSWIRPGKEIRVRDTAVAMDYIDFAASFGFRYILWDAGWYGPENSGSSDASKVVWPIDLQNYVKSARAKDLGLVLYVNQLAASKQLDQILPLYKQWGVAGVKYGFVTVGPQSATKWLHDAVRKAADNHLIVDIHDEYVPTGFSRTYPNLLTQEGIGGDETFNGADQALTFLYTRLLAGPADQTFCYFDPRVTQTWTRAYQLAKPIAFYSPLQVLFWYDKPYDYHNEPELEFWKYMPTDWDESRALQGGIGNGIVMARRKGAEWYLGSLSAVAQTFIIPLDFLGGGWYMAHIYGNGSTAAQVTMGRYLVHSGFSLKAILPKAGGQAVRLVPATAQEIQTYKGQKPAGYQDVIAVYPDTDPPPAGIRLDPSRAKGITLIETGRDTRPGLTLPPGTRSWSLFSLGGRRIASGDREHVLLPRLDPGLYMIEARMPQGTQRFRVLSRD
jgi:alpha-glucosidase